MKRILVTGGCGFIGSHTIVDLIQSGYEVVSLDNLINSSEDVLSGIEQITGEKILNHRIDLKSAQALADLKQIGGEFSGVIHFAALKSVSDSVVKPLEYYQNNVGGLINLLEWIIAHLVVLILGDRIENGMIYTVIGSWIHLGLCVPAAIVFYILKKPSIGSGFLLASLFIGMIGFSMCVGVFASNY